VSLRLKRWLNVALFRCRELQVAWTCSAPLRDRKQAGGDALLCAVKAANHPAIGKD